MGHTTFVKVPKPDGKGHDWMKAVVYVRELPHMLKKARTMPVGGRA